jgi:anthranilate synthase/aminodeoxychorismate synthase-like glutamine amidotransferase
VLVLIDNYDSFTFNLVRYFEELNQSVSLFKNDAITAEQLVEMDFDHLVISPGPCSPNESGVTLTAIEALRGKVPILGVCLGHQAIAQVMGAKVQQARHIRHGKTSKIQCEVDSRLFAQCQKEFVATRYHSLIVAPESLPASFKVSAWCHDFDEAEIMAIEDTVNRLYGVQFHPESLLTEHGHQVLQNFLTLG